MKYYKYLHYSYIVIAGLFLYDGIISISSGTGISWANFLFVALAVFMFFFRRRNIQKLEELEENNKDK